MANDTYKKIISIHAPARGATLHRTFFEPFQVHFNPRSREGSDIHYPKEPFFPFRFQSTLPRGERPKYHVFYLDDRPFQSTLPRGERQLFKKDSVFSVAISIHAPARGATQLFHYHFQE